MVPQMINERSRQLVSMRNLKQRSYEQTWCDMSLNKIIFVTMVNVERTKKIIRVEETLYLPQHHIILNVELPESIVIYGVPILKL